MSSERKNRANRRNAQRSSGPKTPEGKAASAQNAATHGLSSSFAVLPHEDQAAYARLCETLGQEFTPTTEHETFLLSQMAESRWRLERTVRFETIAYEQLLGEVDESNPDHVIVKKLGHKTTNIFDLLQRYRTAAERSYFRAHRDLTQARAREIRNEAKEAQIWLKQQVAKTPIPPIDDPVWYTPSPAHGEIERNEPTGTPEAAEIDDRGGPGVTG